MRKPTAYRLTLAWSMGLVALVALAGAALRSASELEAILSFWMSLTLLLSGTLAAMVRPRRGGWIGFSLFGWSMFLILTISTSTNWFAEAPSATGWIQNVADALHPIPLVSHSLKQTPFQNTPQGRAWIINGGLVPFTKLENEDFETDFKNEAIRLQTTIMNQNCGSITKAVAIVSFAGLGGMIGLVITPTPLTPNLDREGA